MHPAEDPALSRTNPDDVMRVRLRPPPRVPRYMYGVSVLSAMTFWMVWGQAALGAGGWLGLLLLGIAGGAAPLLLIAGRDPPATPVVVLGFDRLRLPRTAELADSIPLNYREIDALFLRPGRGGFIWVGTPKATFMYPRRSFERPEDAERLHEELRARIGARLPDGDARLEAFGKAASAALSAYRRPLPATIGLLTLIVAGTVLMTVLRYNDIFNLVHAGALEPSLVLEHGQWWRLATAGWLSLLPDGLIASITVFVFGMMVERLFGTTQTIIVATAALALGGAMSLLSTNAISFGAPPLALGLFAALAFTANARPGLLPVGFRPPGIWWVMTGSLLVMLTLMLCEQDPSMLVGGALGGVLMTALRLNEDTRLPLTGPTPWIFRLLATAAVAAVFAGGFAAYQNFLSPKPVESTALLRAAKEGGWGEMMSWNELAWRVATAPAPASDDLKTAGALVERAITTANEIDPKETRVRAKNALIDTLATVRYRQGRFDEAIHIQQGVVDSDPQVVFATQLARFINGRTETGTSTKTDGLPAIELLQNPSRGFGLVVRGTVPAPVVVWAVARNEQGLQGLLRFSLSPSTPVDQTIWLRQKGTQASWPAGTRLIPGDLLPGESEWLAWGVDPETVKLP